MKKYILTIVIVIIFVNIAHAQALLIILFGDKLSTEKFQMGINATGSASNLTGIDETNYRFSWAFGAFGEINFNSKWYMQFNLTIKTPGGANSIPGLKPGDPLLDSLFSDVTADRITNYITLPVYLKFKAGSFKFGAGGQVGYLTSATEIYTGKTLLGDDFTLNKKKTSELNRWDAGVTGIVDYFFKPDLKMRSLRLSLTYYYGLTDIVKNNSGDSVNNSVLLLSLGIPVGGGGNDKKD
jgi:hypothetical protein